MGTQLGDGFFVSVRVFDLVSGTLGVTNTASKYPPVAGGRFHLFDLGGGTSHATAPLRKNSSGLAAILRRVDNNQTGYRDELRALFDLHRDLRGRVETIERRQPYEVDRHPQPCVEV